VLVLGNKYGQHRSLGVLSLFNDYFPRNNNKTASKTSTFQKVPVSHVIPIFTPLSNHNHHARSNPHPRNHDLASAPRKGYPLPDVRPKAIVQDVVLVRAAARRRGESESARPARVWAAAEGSDAVGKDVYVGRGKCLCVCLCV
jgi:hypothetical protein